MRIADHVVVRADFARAVECGYPSTTFSAMILPENECQAVIDTTRAWVDKAVIGLNLCPFAKAVQVKGQVRYAVSDAADVDTLYQDLLAELELLAGTDPADVDTCLLIHPQVLENFLDYNDFLDVAEACLEELELLGVLQIASFHPDYQFADAAPDDIENYTNRSPYPILHLLREDSIERAVAALPDAADIYEKNMATLRQLGLEGWEKLGLRGAKIGNSTKT
jgi:hypothetical protein